MSRDPVVVGGSVITICGLRSRTCLMYRPTEGLAVNGVQQQSSHPAGAPPLGVHTHTSCTMLSPSYHTEHVFVLVQQEQLGEQT